MSCLFTTLLPLHISMEKNMLIAVPPIQISEYVRLCQISLDQVGLGYVGYLGVFRLSLARFSSTIRDTVLYRVTNCIMGCTGFSQGGEANSGYMGERAKPKKSQDFFYFSQFFEPEGGKCPTLPERADAHGQQIYDPENN